MAGSVRRAQLATNKLNGHRNRLSELCVERGLYCSTATLLAYGVVSDITVKSRKTHEILKMMTDAGYHLTPMPVEKDKTYPHKNQRLGSFLDKYRTHDYIIKTRGHIMALRQGGLTDTDLNAGPHREILQAWRVTKQKLESPEKTSGFVPIVSFGDR